MVELLETVLEGKAMLIKGKQYFSASSYIKPFIDRLTPFNVNFICNIKMADQVTITGSQVDIAYTRVSVTAVFPKTSTTNYRRALTMAYALDLKTPVVKFYIGWLDDNDNFMAFGENAIVVQTLEPEEPINYTCIQSLLEYTDNTLAIVNSIKRAYVDRDQIYGFLGEWVDRTIDYCYVNICGKTKIATSVPVDAYKMLIKDPDSDFYVPKEREISVYDIYSAFLSTIRDDDRDIINRYEKTFLINLILKLC